MKHAHLLVSTVLAICTAAAQATPVSIYAQGDLATADRGAFQYSQQNLADDFTATSTGTLASASWTGSYYYTAPANGSVQSFTFEIFAGGATPGALLYSYVGNAMFAASSTHASYYDFSMTLADGIVLSKDSAYWVDIYSNSSPADYAWGNSSDGSSAGALSYGNNAEWYNFSGNSRSNHVFALQASDAAAVPEPGSIAILGLGLFGLVAARRKSMKPGR